MNALLNRLSDELSERYVQYLDTFMVDLWAEPGGIDLRFGFTLRRDHQLRTFNLKVPPVISDSDAEREFLIVVMFYEVEGALDAAIAERKVLVN